MKNAPMRSIKLTPGRVRQVPPPSVIPRRAWYARPGLWVLVVATAVTGRMLASALARR